MSRSQTVFTSGKKPKVSRVPVHVDRGVRAHVDRRVWTHVERRVPVHVDRRVPVHVDRGGRLSHALLCATAASLKQSVFFFKRCSPVQKNDPPRPHH